jgi:dephospho-CoA kinase
MPVVAAAGDVIIRRGSVPSHLSGGQGHEALWEGADGAWLIRTGRLARFLVIRPGHVTFAMGPEATDDDARALLLRTPLALLVYLKGMLPLHASCVAIGSQTIALAGESGSGKSSVTMALLERGHHMLADDISAIDIGADGGPIVFPSWPDVELWPDVLSRYGRDVDVLPKVRPALSKRRVSVSEQFISEPRPLHVVVILRTHNRADARVERIAAGARFKSLSRVTWVWPLLRAGGMQARHFQMVSAIERSVRIVSIARPAGRWSADELADLIEHEASAG